MHAPLQHTMAPSSLAPLACCLVAAVAFALADLTAGLPGAHLAAPSAAAGGSSGGCGSDADCSRNGLCTASACICDKPWQGPGEWTEAVAGARGALPLSMAHVSPAF